MGDGLCNVLFEPATQHVIKNHGGLAVRGVNIIKDAQVRFATAAAVWDHRGEGNEGLPGQALHASRDKLETPL
jgi:hypothetical protein